LPRPIVAICRRCGAEPRDERVTQREVEQDLEPAARHSIRRLHDAAHDDIDAAVDREGLTDRVARAEQLFGDRNGEHRAVGARQRFAPIAVDETVVEDSEQLGIREVYGQTETLVAPTSICTGGSAVLRATASTSGTSTAKYFARLSDADGEKSAAVSSPGATLRCSST